MAIVGDIVALLRMDNQDFTSKSRQSRSDAKQTGQSLDVMGKLAIKAASAFSAFKAVDVTFDFLRDAGQHAREFAAEMAASTAIQDLSIDQFERMRQTALDLANDPSVAGFANDLAGGYFYLASAGLTAEQQIASLGQVARFDTAGGFENMALATDLATDTQSALGLASQDTAEHLTNLTRVTDVLIKANTLANATAQQFSEALTTKAGAAARNLGKDIEEVTAVLAAMADQGVKGAEAGTQVSIVLRDLQTKALENAEAFRAAGVSVFDSSGEFVNMADVIRDLESATDGLSDAARKTLLLDLGFSDKSIGALETLFGTSEKIRQYENDLRDAGGTTEAVAEKQLTEFDKVAKQLDASWQEVKITLGEPLLEKMVGSFEEMLPLIDDTATVLSSTLIPVAGGLIDAFTGVLVVLNGVANAIEYVGDAAGTAIAYSFEIESTGFDGAETEAEVTAMIRRLQETVNELTFDAAAEIDTAQIDGLLADLGKLAARGDKYGITLDSSGLAKTRDQIVELEKRAVEAADAVAAIGQDVTPPSLDFDFNGMEAIGDSLDQQQFQLLELQARWANVKDAFDEGRISLAQMEQAGRFFTAEIDKATGGAIALASELETELYLVGATADERTRAKLAADGAYQVDIDRVATLQRDLSFSRQRVELAEELAGIGRTTQQQQRDELARNGATVEQLREIEALHNQIAIAQQQQDDEQRAKQITESVKTSEERLREQFAEAQRLRGLLGEDVYQRRIAELRKEWQELNGETERHLALLGSAAGEIEGFERVFAALSIDASTSELPGTSPPASPPSAPPLTDQQYAALSPEMQEMVPRDRLPDSIRPATARPSIVDSPASPQVADATGISGAPPLLPSPPEQGALSVTPIIGQLPALPPQDFLARPVLGAVPPLPPQTVQITYALPDLESLTQTVDRTATELPEIADTTQAIDRTATDLPDLAETTQTVDRTATDLPGLSSLTQLVERFATDLPGLESLTQFVTRITGDLPGLADITQNVDRTATDLPGLADTTQNVDRTATDLPGLQSPTLPQSLTLPQNQTSSVFDDSQLISASRLQLAELKTHSTQLSDVKRTLNRLVRATEKAFSEAQEV